MGFDLLLECLDVIWEGRTTSEGLDDRQTIWVVP